LSFQGLTALNSVRHAHHKIIHEVRNGTFVCATEEENHERLKTAKMTAHNKKEETLLPGRNKYLYLESTSVCLDTKEEHAHHIAEQHMSTFYCMQCHARIPLQASLLSIL